MLRPRHLLLVLTIPLVGVAAWSPAAVAQRAPPDSVQLLDRAVQRNDLATLRQLLSLGVRPRPETVIRAAGRSSLEVVRVLVDGGVDVNLAYSVGNNPDLINVPLGAAVQGGRADVVELLLQAGAHPDRKHIGQPLATLAAGQGHTEVLNLLIAAGAGLEAPSPMGTPLIHALMGSHTEAARVLLSAGADPEAEGGLGGRALHWAGRSGDPGLVQLLLQAGADPNGRSSAGHTPLMWAAEGGSGATVDVLLTAGADPDARNDSGVHAAVFAKGVSSVVDRLLAASPEMRANRAVPHALDGAVYRPGMLLSGPCTHHGAIPPDAGCGDSGVEVLTRTSIRSGQMLASVAPPECEPVRIPFEDTYTVTVATTESEWVGDRCYGLRRTDGWGREMTYFSQEPTHSTTSYTFTVAADAPVTAADEEKPNCSDRCGNDDAPWTDQEIDEGAQRYKQAVRENVVERENIQGRMKRWEESDLWLDKSAQRVFENRFDAIASDCARISRLLMRRFPEGCKDFLGCLEDGECEEMCGAIGKGPEAFCYEVHTRFYAALPSAANGPRSAYAPLHAQYPCLRDFYRLPFNWPFRQEFENLREAMQDAPLTGMPAPK